MADVFPIAALLSHDKKDVRFHSNIDSVSVYDNTYRRTRPATFTYVTIPFVNSRASFKKTQRVWNSDLIGECFLRFKVVNNNCNPLALLSCVHFCVENNGCVDVLESLDAQGPLRVLEKAQPIIKQVEGGQRYDVVIPLPFFFTHSPASFFPLCNLLHTQDVFVQLDANLFVLDPCLVYKEVIVDVDERCMLMSNIFSRIVHPTRTIVLKNVKPDPVDGTVTVNINDLRKHVKDIKFMCTGASIERAELYLDGLCHMSLDNMMGEHVLPHTVYKSTCNDGVFVMPFCEDPLCERYPLTTDIDFNRIQDIALKFKLGGCVSNTVGVNVNVDLAIVVQTNDVLMFHSGVCFMCGEPEFK